MTDLYCKMFKLTSGETIVCMTDDPCENLFEKKTICIVDPVQINHVRLPKDNYIVESFILTPWVSFSEQPIYDISTSTIIMSSDIKDNLKNNYLEFLNKTKQEDNDDTTIDTDTIDDFFEELEKGLEENEEEINTPGGTRTLH